MEIYPAADPADHVPDVTVILVTSAVFPEEAPVIVSPALISDVPVSNASKGILISSLSWKTPDILVSTIAPEAPVSHNPLYEIPAKSPLAPLVPPSNVVGVPVFPGVGSPSVVVLSKFKAVPRFTSVHPVAEDLYIPAEAPPALFLKE